MRTKNILLPFVLFLFFFQSAFAQKIEWSAFLSTNYTYFGLEDDKYKEPFVGSDPIQLSYFYYDKYDIKRVAKAKQGFGFGSTLKLKVIDNFFVMTGIESQFIRFEKLEWLKKVVEGEATNIIPPQGESFNGIKGGTINRRIISESYQNYSSNIPYFSANDAFSIDQKIMYLKDPLSIGFSPNSKNWMVFAGLWYGRLIRADFGIDESFDIDHLKFFNKNNFGVNIGFQFRVLKNISVIMNYSNFADDIYVNRNPLEESNLLYLDSNNRNQYLDSNKHNQYSLGISYTFLSMD